MLSVSIAQNQMKLILTCGTAGESAESVIREKW